MTKPFIIADVGSNWCVSPRQDENLLAAKRHIYDAARAGVSAVKFQLFTDRELYGMAGPDRYALPHAWLPELAAYCAEQGVEFMCTAFSPDGYLAVDPFVNRHKVASAEMKHVEILKRVCELGKPTLISTGGAHVDEINFVTAFFQQQLPSASFGFLECVAQYPARPEAYNLSTLSQQTDGLFVGISDHTLTDAIACGAAALGATVFEKHFNAMPGNGSPDAPVSIGPHALAEYVRHIRQVSEAVRPRVKCAAPEERDMTIRWRRRLKVIAPIKEGELLQYGKNFGIYRSLTDDAEAGPPEQWQVFDGGMAKRDLAPGDPVWTSTVSV